MSTPELEYFRDIEPAITHGDDADSLADCRGKRIGILIVTYNAVTTLARLLRRIPPEVWKNVEEVVVLDDDSEDATYELAIGLKAVANIDKLHVIKHSRNLGYGGNQKAGYNYFLEKGFDIVVLLHGDGQYAPEVLSSMYHSLVTGEADAVFGSRMTKSYGGPLKGGMPLYKYVGNRILTIFENTALGLELTEFHSGYRAYSLEALRHIDFTHMTNEFHFDTEIIIKLNHQGFRIKEIPIPTYYGDEICYVNGMKYAKDVVRSVLRYKASVRSVTRHPEYREYFVDYPLKESKYSSHYYLQRLTGSNQDVLDIGCGDGLLAEKMVERGNRVTGLDRLAHPAKEELLELYIPSDLSHGLGGAVEQLQGRKFDKVLLMDVLEHLVTPEKVLQEAGALLKSSGQLLVSVPNVANITVRLSLAFGRFNYSERGILDKTHLRWFTRKTARRMLEVNGYEVVDEKVTVMPIELVLGLSPENPLIRIAIGILAFFTGIMPSLLGYQTVLVARAKSAASSEGLKVGRARAYSAGIS